MTLGERILHYRKCAGLSQEMLAERLGVSRQAVSKWEGDAAHAGAGQDHSADQTLWDHHGPAAAGGDTRPGPAHRGGA